MKKKNPSLGAEKHELSPVYIEGSEIEGVKFAGCCTPVPGDEIFAIASNSGITVHCASCQNLKSIEKERYLSAKWKDDTNNMLFDISLRIGGKDEDGVLREIIKVFDQKKIKLYNINAKVVSAGRFEVVVETKLKNKAEVEEIMRQIEKIKPVQFVNRYHLV